MVKIRSLNIIFFFFLTGGILFSQNSRAIKNENLKLQNIREQIARIRKEIKNKKLLEKKSLVSLNILNKKLLLTNQLLNELSREINNKTIKINNYRKRIKKLENKILKLKGFYSTLIRWYYKFGRTSRLSLLLNSNSINEAIIKFKYVSIISKRSKNVLLNLTESRKELALLLKKSRAELVAKQKLLKSKRAERENLAADKLSKVKLLKKLRKNKKALYDEIKRKRLAELKIKKKIEELIKLENERIAKIKKSNNSTKLPVNYDYSEFENFVALKGRLGWPVNNGRITRKFGKNRNKKLKTISINYGIDIATKKFARVKAVAGGIVSAIDWIPGYGSVLILTHKNNFRTVYGHLTDITVSEGDRINAGTVIGHVDESLEGNVLHFEIWRSRSYQNPTKWLVKK